MSQSSQITSPFLSTKVIELGSCAFRQWRATSHCNKIHGYKLTAKLWFACRDLDERNWSVDFGGLKTLKAMLNGFFDHTLTVAADDPELETFRQLHDRGVVDLRVFAGGVGIERAAEHVFNIANNHIIEMTNGRCWVEKVEVFEHEDNSAMYDPTRIVPINKQRADLFYLEYPDYDPGDLVTVDNTYNLTANSHDTQTQPLDKAEAPAPVEVAQIPNNVPVPNTHSKPAPIRNQVTSGKGNWFKGTFLGKD